MSKKNGTPVKLVAMSLCLMLMLVASTGCFEIPSPEQVIQNAANHVAEQIASDLFAL
ncbi:hypothetical protein RAS1_30930 [Phycisphaerae bacterium RAS1]|nr:hypothetical protein RAS1_30930 [Phycisphaerae bacterium RAS1]